MVITMTLPSQADMMWFAILMLGIIILTQLQDRYRKKQERELCDAREEEENDNGGYGKAALVPIRDIRRALDDNKGATNE